MIRCQPTRRGDQVKVTFQLPAADDEPVTVVGDFNHWNPGANAMRRRGTTQTASITLSAGRRYHFRYLTRGGAWFNDDAAHAYEVNEFGEWDGVLDLTDLSRSTARPLAG